MGAYSKTSSKTSTLDTDVQTSTPPRLLRLFTLYENMTRFVLPLCTSLQDRPHPDVPITQSNNIVDISGVGLKQFWDLRNHMQEASTLATAHYPETLDRIFVIGAPAFFPTVWGWIKKWFDPITTSKIFILSNADVKPTLESMIEPRNIPKRFGGELDFEFGMRPILDPAMESSLTWLSSQEPPATLPRGPLLVTEGNEDGKQIIVTLGSKDGVARREKIAILASKQESPVKDPAVNNGTIYASDEKKDEATSTDPEPQVILASK
ncbi:MAG: hypothetical protein M1825_004290 [Sarcosagium campestre]|nr:MAG: hypothetical protein M1825_004290 [Sarcosagium campestre]